jgi:hypothetical protein
MKEIAENNNFEKIIQVIKKNSDMSSTSVVKLSDAIRQAQSFNPMNDVAEKIRGSIIEASKIGLSKSSKEIRYEVATLEKSEQLLELLSETDEGKVQAAQLKKLLDVTKKTLKQNTTFSKRFGGYLVENAKSKIGDAMEQVPFVGPLYAWIRESRKQALEDRKDASQTAIKDSIDLMNSDMAPMRSEAKESSKGALKSIKSTEYLEEIDKTTKETLSVAMRVAGISAEQLEAERMSIPSEEAEREKVRLDNKMLSVLEDISEKSSNGSTDKGNKPNGSNGGLFSGLGGGNIVSGLVGVGGGVILAKVSKMFGKVKGFFGGISKFVSKVPGVSMMAKAAGKFFSFPVQFGIGAVAGMKAALDKYWKTGSLSEAALAGVEGFTDWFMQGFLGAVQDWVSNSGIFERLEQAQDWVSNNGVFEKIFGAIYEVEKFIEGAGGSKATQTGGLQIRELPTPSATPAPKSPASFLSEMIETFNETQRRVVAATGPRIVAPVAPPKSQKLGINDRGGALREDGFIEDSMGVAERLGVKHEDLMKVMNFESGLDPTARNPHSSASGLIQFMGYKNSKGVEVGSASELGTDIESIRNMSAREQLPYVEKYLKNRGIKPGMGLTELYMSILSGHASAAGKTSLWEEGSRQYKDNAGLDINRDGKVSPQEATQKVNDAWNRSGQRMYDQMAYAAEPAIAPSMEQETAEMTYENQSQAAASSVRGSPIIAPNNSRSTTVNNRSTTQTTMQIPVRHQDATLFKFNPVLV